MTANFKDVSDKRLPIKLKLKSALQGFLKAKTQFIVNYCIGKNTQGSNESNFCKASFFLTILIKLN